MSAKAFTVPFKETITIAPYTITTAATTASNPIKIFLLEETNSAILSFNVDLLT